MKEYRLTEYSHGSGCGCKISPQTLDKILGGVKSSVNFPDLLVGNDKRDDAAVVAIDEHRAIISTTDFFMPIVDDPYDFGRIAATNAISDIYAMGGKPIMAISIFGWPIDKLPEEVGRLVVDGGRKVCEEAGIPLAGGHSIDSPEPIFGLAVTGIVDRNKLKPNSAAGIGDLLYLTKPLGIGILTTAEKRKILQPEDKGIATELMLKSNRIGTTLSDCQGVSAITDVTGFGLLGHLVELCESSGVGADVTLDRVPILNGIAKYLKQSSTPGGTARNFASYGHKVSEMTLDTRHILCDPQTSGGLLIAVNPAYRDEIEQILRDSELPARSIGSLTAVDNTLIIVR